MAKADHSVSVPTSRSGRLHRERPRLATALIGIGASGTERRMACVFEHLAQRHPGRHLLILNRELHDELLAAGFRLAAPDLHILEARSRIDRKRGAHSSFLTNLGRLATLLRYRSEIVGICRSRGIAVVQAMLEMVPFLGLWPVPAVTQVASLVSHLPKYYDGRSFSSRLLAVALRNYQHIDALYEGIAEGLAVMGIPREKVSYPTWNCVDHNRFHPEPKEDVVTFAGRAFAFKNPELMLRAIELVHSEARYLRFHVLGKGPLLNQLVELVRRSGLREFVEVGYTPDPSPIINRSRVHVCLEEFDNATNQSLLEGLAAGCGIVASDVGYTSRVVTPDVGMLVPLLPGPIAEAILRLINNPAGLDSMGQAARQKVLRNHNIDAYLAYLTGVLTRSLSGAE